MGTLNDSTPTAPSGSRFHAGHAIGLHMVIELAKEVPLTGDEKADRNIRNAIARSREVQRWLDPLARTPAVSSATSEMGDTNLAAALVEFDAEIAGYEHAVRARRQLAEIEALPEVKATPARNGRPAVRAMAAVPDHGERHRRILEREERRLAALKTVRAALSDAQAERERLQKLTERQRSAFAVIDTTIHEAHMAWDADSDSRCGKLLASLSGVNIGYRRMIDEARAVFNPEPDHA